MSSKVMVLKFEVMLLVFPRCLRLVLTLPTSIDELMNWVEFCKNQNHPLKFKGNKPILLPLTDE